MLEIVSATASLTNPGPTMVEIVALWFLWLVLVVALIAAIVTAVRRRSYSTSYSADILLAVFSPVMYWILFAFGAVSHAGKPVEA